MKDAIAQEALSRIDMYRMSNETFMAHASSRLQEAVRDAGPVVVTVASNVRHGEEGNKREKIDGEPFGRLTACCISEESRVFLTDGEKTLIYEENIATIQLQSRLSPRRLRTRQMSPSFEKSPSIFSIVITLELVDFNCQAEKPLA